MQTRKFLLLLGALLLCAITVSAQTVDEEARADDGSPDGTPVSQNGLIAIIRFTPARYPATLKAMRIYLRRVNPSPVGLQIRLLAFARNSSTPDAFVARPTNYLVNQLAAVPNVATTGEFAEFTIANPPTITSGDFFVGFQQVEPTGIFFWLDGSEPLPLRSYVALPPDGPLQNEFYPSGFAPAQPATNFMIRAVLALPSAVPPIAALSAASYLAGQVAPESIVAVFGANLAASLATSATNPLPTTLAGTTVRIRDSANNERQAGLFFVSPNQINCEVPTGTQPGTATLTVTNGNGQSFATTINVAEAAGGLFTANANGQGVPAAQLLRIKPDNSLVYEPIARFDQPSNQWVPIPITLGLETDQVFLILYGTGWRGRASLNNVTINIAQFEGIALPVTFAGAQGMLVGLDQINARLPRTLAGKGEMYLRTHIDGRSANLVKVNFQ